MPYHKAMRFLASLGYEHRERWHMLHVARTQGVYTGEYEIVTWTPLGLFEVYLTTPVTVG